MLLQHGTATAAGLADVLMHCLSFSVTHAQVAHLLYTP
jgi:hypothetical protein